MKISGSVVVMLRRVLPTNFPPSLCERDSAPVDSRKLEAIRIANQSNNDHRVTKVCGICSNLLPRRVFTSYIN